MSAKHTPGPWEASACENGQEWEVCKWDGHKPTPEEPWFVALCYDDADGATAEANALLISAAPDLLEALEGAIGALEFSRDYHSDLSNAEQAFAQDKLDAATKAIAKAKGESA